MLKHPSRLREVTNNEDSNFVESSTHTEAIHLDPMLAQEDLTLRDDFRSYAEALCSGDTDEVFGEGGLLAKFYAISRAKLEHLDPAQISDDSWADLQLECRTWDLIQRLYMERTKESDAMPKVASHSSNHTLIQNLYDTDNDAAETKIVLDWLHDGRNAESGLEIKSNRWFHTRESIKARKRFPGGSKSENLVDFMDPDAPIRQKKRLAEEDQEYERSLIKAMFTCVRSGDYILAADLARQSNSPWRAASLQGCVDHFDPALDGIEDENATAEGTAQKPLWRRMCFALSQQPKFESYERALYGAMCGDISSVSPVCTTWEDRLWVNFNAMNQSKIETHLNTFGRIDLVKEFPIMDFTHLTPSNVLESLLNSEDGAVRAQARAPLRVVQSRLITKQIDILLEDIYRQLQSVQGGGPLNVGASPHLVKFVVHLILTLRKLQVAVPERPANAIIQAYVEILIMAEEAETVALYASQLSPSDTVEALARYFMLVEDEHERKVQLENAQKFRVDTRVTILRTVELVFEQVLSEFALGEEVRNINTALTKEEERCIRALEWLKLDETLQAEAIMLGNSLFRKLLLCGRTSAARVLASRMPDTKIIPMNLLSDDQALAGRSQESQMRDAIEYAGYCTLVKALVRYEEWKLLMRERPQEINGRRDPVGLRQWKGDLARLRSECITIMQEILGGNWCETFELGVRDVGMKNMSRTNKCINDIVLAEEMANLRTMYIPDVVLKLHGVHAAHEGRDVSAAMELAVLVSENFTAPMKQSGLLATYVSEIALLGAYLA